MNREIKQCQNCKQSFTIEPDDFAFYEKLKVPAPTFCPDCRYQRRIANRNEWNFYKRDCGLCKKSMVSIYNPAYFGPVYCNDCWWSDKWDPLAYGRDFDFSKTFFEQFSKLRFETPRITLANSKSINSEYSNQSEENKNCYMVVATGTSENCMYGNWYQGSKDCVDCWAMYKCEIMYESLNCRDCYKCFFVEDNKDCHDMYFSKDCRLCSNCFGCVSLRGKTYCWFNEQLSKDEYQKRLAEVLWTQENIDNLRKKLDEFSLQKPVKFEHSYTKNENSTGDYIGGNKNVHYGFNARLSENLKFGQDAWEARDCMDLTETLDNELEYEGEGSGWGNRNIASAKSWWNNDALYSDLNFNCNNIFGCVSLHAKSYCILNKQYSEKEYYDLKEKIIAHMRKNGEWGEFFPAEISPFPYNDSLAQDYFPMTKDEVIAKGLRWHDRDARDYKVTLPHENLPEKIGDASDSILKEVISCSLHGFRCATAFRLHPAELQFYRQFNLPIPHKCFPCRLQERLARRNPRKLWHRQCMCLPAGRQATNTAKHFHGDKPCPNEFETSYAPDRPEIVYCEECYNKEVA